jgi:hypothetical protein
VTVPTLLLATEGKVKERLTWAIPFALLAGVLNLTLYRLHLAHDVWWKTWEHPAREPWTWVPFIHSPFFTQYMRGFEAWSERTGTYEGELLMLVHVGLVPLVVLLGVGLAADGPVKKRWIGFAAALLAVTPTAFRPFEQYPLAVVLTTAALTAVLVYARRGGPGMWAVALVLSFAAVEFHLSVWFVLLPLVVLLGFACPQRRRGLGTIGLLALLACWGTMQEGVFANSVLDVLTQPGVRRREIFDVPNWHNPTLEYLNPMLLGALALFALPPVRRLEPRGLPVAVALAIYVVVHGLLMQQGLALHRGAPEPHHYFELVDPMAIAVAVWALAAAYEAFPQRRRMVLGGAALVVLGHLALTVRLGLHLVPAAPLW